MSLKRAALPQHRSVLGSRCISWEGDSGCCRQLARLRAEEDGADCLALMTTVIPEIYYKALDLYYSWESTLRSWRWGRGRCI